MIRVFYCTSDRDQKPVSDPSNMVLLFLSDHDFVFNQTVIKKNQPHQRSRSKTWSGSIEPWFYFFNRIV